MVLSAAARCRIRDRTSATFHWDAESITFAGSRANRWFTKYRGGRPYREWVNAKRERNEPADARIYSIAALFSLLMGGLNPRCTLRDLPAHAGLPPCGRLRAMPPKPNGAPAAARSRWMDLPEILALTLTLSSDSRVSGAKPKGRACACRTARFHLALDERRPHVSAHRHVSRRCW